jgi:hypothetical protein
VSDDVVVTSSFRLAVNDRAGVRNGRSRLAAAEAQKANDLGLARITRGAGR